MKYVDGFVFSVPKAKMTAYRALAKKASKVWMEHGALQYFECAGDDVDTKFGLPFPKLAKTKPDEVPMYSFIIYKSRAHRNKVNAKVMADPRMTEMAPKGVPFDMKRMAFGGFEVIVEA